MNWPDEVVEAGALEVRKIALKHGLEIGARDHIIAQAALSAITLQDIAKLPKVKALLEALQYVKDRNWTSGTPQAGSWINEFCDVAHKALTAAAPWRKLMGGV